MTDNEFPSDAEMSNEMINSYEDTVFAEIKKDHEKGGNADSIINTAEWWN